MPEVYNMMIGSLTLISKQSEPDATKPVYRIEAFFLFYQRLKTDARKKSPCKWRDLIFFQDLVRTRRYVKKFMLMRANIQAVSLKIQTLKSQSAMANAMKGVTKAMGSMNKQMKLPEIQKIMMEFEKQSEIMDMKGEMMEDAIGKTVILLPHSGL